FAPIVLTKLFSPLLEQKAHAKIIFITSGLVYAPRAVYPIYCATKSALHSFIMTLRLQAGKRPLDIIEVAMPVVDTPFHQGNAPKMAITPDKAARMMVDRLTKNKREMRIGSANFLYIISRISPALAFRMVNQI
ncbi:MAG TPA: SDR family NAD(P)-dependent oxidoreductase, partial [Spirochaetota bacterium]